MKQNENTDKRLQRLTAASENTGYSVHTLRKMIERGEISSYRRKDGRLVFVDVNEIFGLLEPEQQRR